MKRLLPLHEMAVNFGLVSNHPVRKRGRKSFFSPEGKVALMFMKMYTKLSAPKLMKNHRDIDPWKKQCASTAFLRR